jgi:hypothetical protein
MYLTITLINLMVLYDGPHRLSRPQINEQGARALQGRQLAIGVDSLTHAYEAEGGDPAPA